MAVFGGMTLTNKGLALQGKAQAGTQLNYTRIAIGDGSLSGQSVPALNALISLKKSLPIARLQMQPPNKVIIGTTLSNADITTGFYFREVGVFAQDPDVGEILYAYANAGVTADYIAPGGGTDIIEKAFDCVVVVGTAANIKAVIDESLVFAKKSELDAVEAAKVDKISGKGLSANDYTTTEKNKLSGITAGAGGAGTASDAVIGNRTITDTTAPTGDTGTITTLLGWLANMIKSITGKSSWRTAPATTLEAAKAHADDTTRHLTAAERTAWNAKETPAGAQDKADAAKTAASADATAKAAAAQAAAATDATAKANAVQANLTAHIGAGGTAHAVATTTVAGFQSAADKAKLDGVAAGANNYTHPATHPPGIIVQDASNRFVTDTEKSTWNAKASTAAATTTTAGLESAADKAKLDGIAAGATVVANSASNGAITINGTNATVYMHPNHTGDVTSTGDGVTAIAAGVIVDADVNASAAIAWSKLSKTGASLADLPTRSAGDLSSGTLPAARLPAISGDITMAAGAGTATITAGAIVDADISTTAGIAWAKVNSTAAVADADIAAAAAIGWNKVSKTGASLADLPTRSAADLSSGTLAAARLPAISGDITMAAGSGTAAITAGVIVNADINVSAGIDAAKIGTGVVSNAEFGYLDGVAAGIQGQLDAKSGIVDYVRQPAYSATAGTGAAYTVTLNPAPASIAEGFGITIVPNVVNTASPTLNINGLGAVALKDQKGVAYAAGKLLVGKPYMFRKVGTDFLADSAGGSGNAVTGDIRAGKTAATDAGDVTGTLAVQTGGTVTPGPSAQVKAAGIYDTAITVAGVTVPAANVLAGTTIAGTAGTMPNRANDQLSSIMWTDGAGNFSVGFPTGAYITNSGFGTGYASAIVQDVDFVAANFRADKNIFGLQGSMPNRSAENHHMPANQYTTWVGDRVFLQPPVGYYSGESWVTAPVPNLRAENIRAGYDVLGIVGTLSGRQYATGTAYFDGSDGRFRAYVTGLSFTPTIVLGTVGYNAVFAYSTPTPYMTEPVSGFWTSVSAGVITFGCSTSSVTSTTWVAYA